MKKIFKVGGVIFVLGVIMTIVGAAFHGVRAVEFVNFKPQILQKGKTITKNYALTDFTKINYSATGSAYDVEIKQGSSYKVTYSGNSKYAPEISSTGGVLTIGSKHNYRSTFGFYYINYEDRVGKLTITVPKDTKLTSLNVKGYARELTLSNLNLAKLASSSSSYTESATFKNLTVDKLDFELDTSSELSIKDSEIKGGTLSTSGDLRISGGKLTNVAITSNEGDVTFLNGAIFTGGSVELSDADFTASNVTFHGSYEVTNSDGDNNVSNVNVQGYRLTTTDGTNILHDQEQTDGGTLTENADQTDVLNLSNQDGDNTVR